MAENQEDRSREDLTEEASPHRIEEYRRRGMVAQSREITAIVALLAAGVVSYAMSPSMGRQLAEFMRDVFRSDFSAKMDFSQGRQFGETMLKTLRVAIAVGFPICLAGFIFGIASSFAQIGGIFSMDPLQPDISKIDPFAGLKRMFSLKQVFEGVRLLLKTLIVLAVSYAMVKSEILRSPDYVAGEPETLVHAYGHAGWVIFIALCAVLGVFAAIDYAIQRWDFSKNLRMTKQEARQEHKEREGDPQIKARIRSIQREMARRRMMQAVRKADVVVTNPTHIAVAITYDRENMGAPKVVAKGADFIAQRIKKIAADAGVPMVENVPLARTLYKSVKVGQQIPRVLYQAVAEVLAYVYRLKKRNF